MEAPKFTLKYAEVMASYACNLSCVGCTNYSDYNYKGHPSWAEVEGDLVKWIGRIFFDNFALIGGEPLLNPMIDQWLFGLRKLMPDTTITLVTNGTRIKHVPELLEWLAACAPAKLTVAPHIEHDAIGTWIEEAVQKYSPQSEWLSSEYIDVDGTKQSMRTARLKQAPVVIEIFVPRIFVKSYRGSGANILPWTHNNAAKAIEMCPCRFCPLMYRGRLYKCSQIAILRDHLTRLGLLESKEWQPYLQYRGIGPDDDESAIRRFVQLFGAPEMICTMCPGEGVPDSLIDHRNNVLTKKQWLEANPELAVI
ncbi:MAG TPA: radical SAM protein [Bryobacteraceae bacterium]|jgi:organic radical activating enzyme|nr:radical SAM protein [Bryobacteraceae bacterium]